MKPNEFSEKIKSFSQALLVEMPKINASVAMNAFGMVADRIRNEGIDGKGRSLGTYSENPLPLFFYKPIEKAQEIADKLGRKGITGKGSRKTKKEFKATSLSYEDWRKGNKLETSFVNLNFSGAASMWNDTGVVKQIVDSTKIITTVGAKNTKDRSRGDKKLTTDDIMGFNKDHYGDFLEVNKDEEKGLALTYDSELQLFINKYFG